MFKNKTTFANAFKDKMKTMLGKSIDDASTFDKYDTLSSMIKESINKRMAQTNSRYLQKGNKQVYYFSMEFLLGRLLGDYLLYLNARELCEEGLKEIGISLEELEKIEPDAGLGNGGLGRLAACFLDSMASLGIPGHGCGIRYKYGLFTQKIIEGYQVELPDTWLREHNVWEIRKSDKAVEVRFGGNIRVETQGDKMIFIHENYNPILAVPYDIPILGYDGNCVNTLRLWSAESAKSEFDFASFNKGDYMKAAEYKTQIEAISEVLYPDDSNFENRLLRLKQEYFMVSAGLQSIIRRFKKSNGSIDNLPEKVAIHINDTHPAMAVPELMRILLDEEGMEWEQAWDITTRTISYTNHTIMPEALEKWPMETVKFLLPRIFMIINEINERFCKELWDKRPGDWDRIRDMAIIADGYVKMAHLAIVGSYSVNGVAEVHSEILKKDVLKNFYDYTPTKFNNKTNGITHRRWLLKANPMLSDVITEAIGNSWIYHPSNLIDLVRFSHDTNPDFQEKVVSAKKAGKEKLAKYINEKYSININTDSIFDVQVKRIHAYKRQLLNAFRIMEMYNRLKENPSLDVVPRTFIFAGKAAPSYYFAKKIIKLINSLGNMINNDTAINDKMKVVFLENYNVSLAEIIFPASDISEQISTASKEASGTSNMKFMMNGAITVGTMDGANIEIFNEVGKDNIFTFGLSVDEVLNYYRCGGYCSWDYFNNDCRIRTILEQLQNNFLQASARDEFMDIYRHLLDQNDEFFVLRDFNSYLEAQQKADLLYRNKEQWTKMAINNIAHAGRFGSDETILKYAKEIWKIKQIF